MRRLVSLAVLMPLAAGCGAAGNAAGPVSEARAATPAAAPAAAPAAPPAAPAAAVPASGLPLPSACAGNAPDTFTAAFDTTQGEILVDVTRAWSPHGADRFWCLVQSGFYADSAFFRVIPGFMAQVGLHGDPAVNKAWRDAPIQDDPVVRSNTRGMVSFAQTSAPNSRTTQFFISFRDNSNLDAMGFAPFGKVRDMGPVDRLHGGYGEGAPRGRGPSQARIQQEGNAYLKAEFPKLDWIRSARIVE